MIIKVNTKSIGRLRPKIHQTELELENAPTDTRSLICETVEACVRSFRYRADNEILPVLTDGQIADMAEQGKISFGEVYGEKDIDAEAAKENAIQCFEDGIYRVFIGNRQLTRLDEKTELDEKSELTFVRLTMLSGRLW